jgi:hypothetical protein
MLGVTLATAECLFPSVGLGDRRRDYPPVRQFAFSTPASDSGSTIALTCYACKLTC